MDAKEVIDQLKALGLTEYAIAKRLKVRSRQAGDLNPPISQSTINRIATGKSGDPSYRVWRTLSDLLAELTIEKGAKPPLVRASA